MVSWALFSTINNICRWAFQITFTWFLHLRSIFDRALCTPPFRMLDCK
jgi:hypothetical protein